MDNATEASVRIAPKLVLSGLDSLYVCYYLDVQTSDVDFEELAYQKERLKESRSDDMSAIELGGMEFALKPYGRYPYKYTLANHLFEIRLTEHMQPTCHVQFHSEGLWMLGLDALLGKFSDWCTLLNLSSLKPEVISRADWAFDYALQDIDFEPNHFLTRAAKDVVWHEYSKTQSIQFGTGNVVIRVYDKVAEIAQQSSKAWFFELWEQKEDVWRIEFQVRGPRLKRAAIRTINNLKDLQNDLLRELAQSHTSLRKPNSDSNKSRWPFHPVWKDMLKQINALPQTGLVQEIDPLKPLSWRLYQQSKSLYGMLKGMGVLLHASGKLPDEFKLDDVIAAMEPQLRRHHRRQKWEYDIDKRIKAYRLGQW